VVFAAFQHDLQDANAEIGRLRDELEWTQAAAGQPPQKRHRSMRMMKTVRRQDGLSWGFAFEGIFNVASEKYPAKCSLHPLHCRPQLLASRPHPLLEC